MEIGLERGVSWSGLDGEAAGVGSAEGAGRVRKERAEKSCRKMTVGLIFKKKKIHRGAQGSQKWE